MENDNSFRFVAPLKVAFAILDGVLRKFSSREWLLLLLVFVVLFFSFFICLVIIVDNTTMTTEVVHQYYTGQQLSQIIDEMLVAHANMLLKRAPVTRRWFNGEFYFLINNFLSLRFQLVGFEEVRRGIFRTDLDLCLLKRPVYNLFHRIFRMW